MFSQDVFAHYGGAKRFGERAQVWTGRVFVILITALAYLIGLRLEDKAGIFELAIRFAFSGFAALAPVMLAALFWKRSTKWGALAATLWVGFAMAGTWWLHEATFALAPKPGQALVQIFPALGDLLLRSPSNVLVFGYLPVLPMCWARPCSWSSVRCSPNRQAGRRWRNTSPPQDGPSPAPHRQPRALVPAAQGTD